MTRERIFMVGTSLTKIFGSIENSINLIAEDLATNVEHQRLEQLFALFDKEKSELMELLVNRATFQSLLAGPDRGKAAQFAVRPLSEDRPEASGCGQ